jgi:N-acylneuraminate cytidylyltransferase/CMP-N,N'-diacetyllegionaminic acid synthase
MRGGSKGVPRKSLRVVAGQSLLARAIYGARQCRVLDEVVVSTDDAEMAQAAAACGARVPFMRPAELAQDGSSKWDVFRHLVLEWERMDGRRVELIADLDTGVPMRTSADIEASVELLRRTDADVVATAYEADRNPYFNMVEEMPDGSVKVVMKGERPLTCRQEAPVVYSLSPSIFAIKRDALWTYEHWSQAKFRVHVIPRERAMDIDTELDLHLVEFLMSRLPVSV